MLQCVAVCCSVLQRVALNILSTITGAHAVENACIVCCSVLQCVAVCCSVLQCVAVCCSACTITGAHTIENAYMMCCSVMQCVAVCCSVLQCVAVCCSTYTITWARTVENVWIVCCSALQRVAVKYTLKVSFVAMLYTVLFTATRWLCCHVVQSAFYCNKSTLHNMATELTFQIYSLPLQRSLSAVCCSALQWVAVSCSELQCSTMYYSVLQCVTVYLSMNFPPVDTMDTELTFLQNHRQGPGFIKRRSSWINTL